MISIHLNVTILNIFGNHLVEIINEKDPRIDPCGTPLIADNKRRKSPAFMIDHADKTMCIAAMKDYKEEVICLCNLIY